jgi:hypothetical protein
MKSHFSNEGLCGRLGREVVIKLCVPISGVTNIREDWNTSDI